MSPLLRDLRLLGLVEGTSTLLLFFVAMPLKYGLDMDAVVTVVGAIHGGLFTAYVVLLAIVQWRVRWPIGRSFALGVAAVVPFGPFVMDPRIARWARESGATRDHRDEAEDRRD